MFIFKYDTILNALKKYSAGHYHTIQKLNALIEQNDGIATAHTAKEIFMEFEKKSIDFAVMEKVDNMMVIPASFGWNDVGNFTAFEALFEADEHQNVIRNIQCISVDSSNNIIISNEPVQRVSLLGVHEMIVVVNQKEILICSKEKNQEIKKILKLL